MIGIMSESIGNCMLTQIPCLEDDNFEFCRQSLMLVARAIEVHEFVESHVNPAQLDRKAKKAFYLLSNAMLTSLSDKARRIVTGGGNIEELAPFEMLT